MVSESTSQKNRNACYKVLQAHAYIVAERAYNEQLAHHLKKGRKKSTFKFVPTEVLNKLIKMSKQVVGTMTAKPIPKGTPPGKMVPFKYGRVKYGITPAEVMGYLAHDYDFNKARYG
jgi:hypothetical protein